MSVPVAHSVLLVTDMVLAGVTVQMGGYPPLAAIAMSAGIICMVLMTIVVVRLGAEQGEADEFATALATDPAANATASGTTTTATTS